MNIKEYYESMSRLYLHQIILCVFVLICIILPCLHITKILPASTAAIFLAILILYYFLRHLYFVYRCSHLPSPYQTNWQGETLLLMAPSAVSAYSWKLFTSDGFCHFSIKEEKKFNKDESHNKNLSLTCLDHPTNNYWTVLSEREVVQVLKADDRPIFKAISIDKREYRSDDRKDVYRIFKGGYSYSIHKNGRVLMTISRGLMPISLQRLFSASTPIIKFDRHIKEHERFFCLALFFLK
ncbi:hypothetical protein [Bacillus niameyensis]|uniref:hypothetical protein n=1 Tax=Bacillus niameyensis TaxID=1522308 RepID=UPI000782B401|nr:hypothetical protein [Bacillus niameyensis]